MTCTTSGPNGEISALWRPSDARLELTVQPAPAHAGSGLDLFEELNGGLRVKMCVWLGVSRGLDLAFLNAD